MISDESLHKLLSRLLSRKFEKLKKHQFLQNTGRKKEKSSLELFSEQNEVMYLSIWDELLVCFHTKSKFLVNTTSKVNDFEWYFFELKKLHEVFLFDFHDHTHDSFLNFSK